MAIERVAYLACDRIEPTRAVTGTAAEGDAAAEADTVASFVRRYYEHVGPDDVLGIDPADL